MSEADRDLHPYSLDVQPVPSKPGKWQWSIRLHGKMAQRSDRMHDSEERARQDGLASIERLRRSSDRMF
ncbi:hypothetical protein [Methylobacterium nigriterrae]|uniref:hypothetical protein n=1 Tax=Methylobacterium nigriterrae TaxID=3127512 RepID=UPI003013842A